jgi:hypothetical protein
MSAAIPEGVSEPADPRSAGPAGETFLHGCRIHACGRDGAILSVHLVATSAERVDPLDEFADLDAALAAAQHDPAPFTGESFTGAAPPTPGGDRPAAPVPLHHVFTFHYPTADDAAGEGVVIDFWGSRRTPIEVHVSGMNQGVRMWDPLTGIATGIRLELGN